MSNNVVEFIGTSGAESGKSDAGADTDRSFGVKESDKGTGQSIGEPEILIGFETFNPTDARAADTAGGTKLTKSGRIDRRTRAGRTNGAGTSETQEVQKTLAEKLNLTDILLSLHQMGVAFTGIVELELEKEEAEKLSKAIQRVNEFYMVNMDPKKLAWINLGSAVATVYGTRILAYRARTKMEAKRTPAPHVTPISEPKKTAPVSGQQPLPNGAPPSMSWFEPAAEVVPMGG